MNKITEYNFENTDFLESADVQEPGNPIGSHYALIGIGLELRRIADSLEKLTGTLTDVSGKTPAIHVWGAIDTYEQNE